MLQAVSKYWWVLLLRGILAIVFGIAIWFVPGLALVTLVIAFGAYALVDGIVTSFMAFSSRDTDRDWGAHLVEGILGILFGIVALTWPELTTLTTGMTILIVIGVWAIVTGVLQIAAAIRLRKEIDNELWLGLSGALSVIFGFVIFRFPASSALALLWLIGSYSIIFGILFIMLAFKVKGMGEQFNQYNIDNDACAHDII